MSKRADGTPAQVRVEGWQRLFRADLKDFIAKISDHCSLFVGRE